MLADLHTHSIYSFDGKPDATIDNMARAAIAAGLTHLAITDHCDIDGELAGRYQPPDRDAQYEAISRAKEIWRDKLTILFGIELGQAPYRREASLQLLAKHPYDIVLGSLHNLEDEEDFYFFDHTKFTDAQRHDFFARVLHDTLDVCEFPEVKVITHLTYMERYMFRQGMALDYSIHREGLCRLFRKIVDKGLVLELNTSDLALGYALPPAPLLQLYRECGGTRVCLGSDAHQPADIGRNFKKAQRMLLDCGFTELTIPTATGDITYPIQKEALL